MVDAFIRALRDSPRRRDVFNPWWQVDGEHDIGESAPVIRRRQLACYLQERLSPARYVLLGEAVGYQGGHFSGIPMTSERILTGRQRGRGILPEHVFRGLEPAATSRPGIRPGGFSEPTATIVWELIIHLGIDPYEIVLWNAFPWHPFDAKKGMLSNRTPEDAELLAGREILEKLLDMFRPERIFALGNKADSQLRGMGIDAVKLRHPANGGAGEFRRLFSKYVRR